MCTLAEASENAHAKTKAKSPSRWPERAQVLRKMVTKTARASRPTKKRSIRKDLMTKFP
jgi:hypothetical protein